MDSPSQTQSGPGNASRQQIDFGAKKDPKKDAQKPTQKPTPVISAKAAINAMYAERAKHPQPPVVASAREAVNAAAQQAGIQHTNSAANLHHGSIQRNMESTRPSASAILRRADDNTKIDMRAGSLDPLAKAQPAAVQKRPEREIPVVRTSLKLGAAARPKPAPVVLPPNARMAQVARPVGARPASSSSRKLAKLLRRNAVDAQTLPTPQVKPRKTLSQGQAQPASDAHALTVKIIPSQPAGSTRSPRATSRRKVSAARDPQMLSCRPSRFRTKPKDFSASHPAAMPADTSYVMAEPPKLNLKKKPSTPDQLGVIENFHLENPPQPLGDKAPTGSLKAQKVASGHVGAAPEAPAIKADNTSNYSFSKPKSEPDNNRYALGGESPFLKSVNVEKRPLSDSPHKFNPKVERKALPASVDSSAPAKGRKNHYAKKSVPAPHQELPSRPTVIIPSNRRSKAPLVFLVLLTIILGAAVGAAVYLCFFQ